MSTDLSVAVRGALLLFDHGARRVWLCGSLTHGRHWDELSDLDYAVTGMTEDRRLAAVRSLIATTGRGIDVIPWDDAPAHLRVQICSAMVEVARDGVIGSPPRGPLPPVTALVGTPLPRGLHQRRHVAVLDALARTGASDVLDMGCGGGELAAAMVARDGVRVTAVDRDPAVLAGAEAHLAATLDSARRERVDLRLGHADDLTACWRGQDALVAVEVIEHLDEPVLAAFAELAFGVLRPATVLLTTPNADYNALLPGLGLRHADHRFEWGVEEFRNWAQTVAAPHGYAVALTGIGAPHTEYGAPSQLCRLTRTGAR
jgi:SAM-dependent methyltransferase